MHLADIGLLNCQYVQLLADSIQPVYIQKLTPVAEALIQLGLLRLQSRQQTHVVCSGNHG
jgi:hypothetical protein